MFSPKSHIHLDSDDLARSAIFYEALLGTPPSRQSETAAVFEVDSPPLVLTLQRRRPADRARFALVVKEPQEVGHAAIALRRAGIHLRLQDEGIEADDPDGNAWRVRCVPSAKARSVVAPPEARGGRR